MRYIGSKRLVLPFIKKVVEDTFGDFSNAIVGDLFAGTACVGEMFKRGGAQVLSNDYMSFSYALQVEKICLNRTPDSPELYADLISQLNALEGINGFFYNEYTIGGTAQSEFQRNYFSERNAQMIDAMRLQIERWLQHKSISKDMYYLLIANLIDAVTRVSNTSGTYGAFLKQDDPRKNRPIYLFQSHFADNGKKNQSYCKDIFEIIDDLEGDILYLDPPYNSRQYPPYYHILETVSLYDNPAIYGKTGRRPYDSKMSPFCMADKAEDSLVDIVKRAKFSNIYISYSTDGIISYSQLSERLKALGTVKIYFMQYRRYKSNSFDNKFPSKNLKEIILYVKK